MTKTTSPRLERVKKGQAILQSHQNLIVDRLNQSRTGTSAFHIPISPFVAMVKNSSGADADFGTLLYLGDYLGLFEDKPLEVQAFYDTAAMAWHGAIAQAVVTLEPIVNGETGQVALFGQCVVKSGSNADASGGDGTFAIPDPTDPTKIVASTGGIGRILANCGENHVTMLLGNTQNLFCYRMLESSQAPDTTSAKLVSLEGDDIGDINLSDPKSLMDDQGTDDEGFCVLTGNEFRAIQAPCA